MCCDHDSHYIDPILLLIRTHTGTCLQSTIAEITHNCVKSSQMCGSAWRKRKGGMLSPLFPYVPWLLLLCTGIQMTGRRSKAKEKGDVNVNIKTRRTFNRCIHIISYWPYSFNLTNFRMKSLDTRALHFNASGHFPLYDAVRIWSHTVQYHKYKDTLVPEIKSNQNWHNSICVDFNCSTFHLSDISTYLSAWFQHTFNSLAMDQSQQGNALSPQQWFYLWQMYWPNLAPWCAATWVWISSCSGCVTDALMVFSHPSGQAHSFCHSTSSMVTAALSALTHSYLPK